MPTTYAHWAFGRECIELMPKDMQRIVNEHRDIFNIGVHGPDIFFYDLLHSDVTKYGSGMHFIPAKEFFSKCKEVLLSHKKNEREEMLSYVLGFLSHFTLDSTVHGYVDRKKEVSKISHNYIESQWDRHVMELDNRKPNLVDRAESLKPNKNIAKAISYFFPFDEKVILRTCRWQRFIVYMTNAITPLKQNIFQKILHKIGKPDYADLFIGFEEDNICKDSNLRLDKLENKALKQYSKLLKNFLNYIDDKEKLIKYFDHDFSDWPDYKEIPVLSYKKELTYKV